jgi:glycosyltransferase involved in cell wall biosynthesis
MTREDRSVRLLYVINEVDYFLAHWVERAVAARDSGFDVHVAAPGAERWTEIEAAGLTFHPISLVRNRLNPVAEANTIRALVVLYRRLRPEIVHHVTIKPVIYGGLAARRAGVPGVVSTVPGLGSLFASQGLRTRALRMIAKIGYRMTFSDPAARVVFENGDDLRDFVAWRLINETQGAVIKGAGVDTDRFRPIPEPEGPIRVVMAARLLWEKGVADFVEAARMAHEAQLPVQWVLVGDTDLGSPSAVPVAQLQAWHDDGVIDWVGRQSDMPAVLGNAHIVCHPSRYREGVPRVLIDAAACGRPCVTTDAPGCRDIVRDGDNGLLVPLGDPLAVTQAVAKLARDPELRRRMGQRGREIAVSEFAKEIVIDALLTTYGQLSR